MKVITTKGKKLRKDTKYKHKYSRELEQGLLPEHWSELKLATYWNINHKTFQKWKETIPRFAVACEMASTRRAAWWMERLEKNATGEERGSSASIELALSHNSLIGWSRKTSIEHHHDEQISTIKIEVLPTREQLTQLNIIEAEPVRLPQLVNSEQDDE
jgi:hypothetical protein